MSIFKTKGVILKINKLSNNDFLYTIFTYDYGTIRVTKKNSKSEKMIDVGYLINFEIETKNKTDIHKVRNIKILAEFNTTNKSFAEINAYLILLGVIYKNIPSGLNNYEIFNILEYIIKYNNITEIKLVLAKLKVVNILGNLNINNNNKTVSKILKFINNNKIGEIMKLSGINDETKKELRGI